MRRPGGAVSPAMNETTGLVVLEACSGVRNARRPEAGTPRLDELCSLLLRRAADFAYHNDSLSLRVRDKALQAIHKVGAVERVAPDANACGLAQPHGGCLKDLCSKRESQSTKRVLLWAHRCLTAS